MWTCLWMLWLAMILLEKFIRLFRTHLSENISFKNSFLISISIFSLSLSLGVSWLFNMNFEIFTPLSFSYLNLPSFLEIRNGFNTLPLFKLIITTILITFFASGIAIGTPPLLLVLFPGKFPLKVQNLIWIFFRLIPLSLIHI